MRTNTTEMHDALLTLHFLSLLAYAFVKFEDKHEAEVLITINNLYSHNYAFCMYRNSRNFRCHLIFVGRANNEN